MTYGKTYAIKTVQRLCDARVQCLVPVYEAMCHCGIHIWYTEIYGERVARDAATSLQAWSSMVAFTDGNNNTKHYRGRDTIRYRCYVYFTIPFDKGRRLRKGSKNNIPGMLIITPNSE